ncbi:MAG: hypothetical protein A2W61_00960 [Deltaproteobacteria bacterium RIFCSPLOWO2_01_44_7]|nr:MAG: hypothetical protein A2712_03090 [Deltaproteobacteria bacterium RIFCSPHIGHO2_01_FULL_43_49]OGQ16180.1 MAG: hypothetical protein A3D22_01060 [Deltaproteobacteria bacterium RIFCSPHIGHO2_02_FULL_44_53]OGQ29141.1 MAG: hypothetical protein A3D98_04845 [Deltaproteobacteria bacterium RIFCSPHIGHO2_12_FULL_44_21]OGQ32697.1 MAG: hypothetical protein A2979_08990 [Deltaproteobacteria bacterium RIFCSPLOWO2_01_FULL_45_74]OGQ38004.1 MAG: hypothetical protein A2W61_00960 [Deltaproteobacteria bacterium 
MIDVLTSDGLDPILFTIKHHEDSYVILRDSPGKIFKVREGKKVLVGRTSLTFKAFLKAEDVAKEVKRRDLKPEEAKEAISAARSERIQFVRSEDRDRVWLQLLAEAS